MRKVYVSYCNGSNFGDELNIYILEKFLEREFVYSGVETAQVLGIGSIMEWLFIGGKKWYVPKLNVFTTGFAFNQGILDYSIDNKVVRDVRIYALRGKESLKQMRKLLDISFENVVIGDGGLLASYLLDKPMKKKYELGIVPHFKEKSSVQYYKLANQIKNSIILDVEKNPIDFIRDLSMCKRIISSAMHPLIVADSLRIPNMWCRLYEETTSKYKFYDYYSAFGKSKSPIYLSDINYATICKKIDGDYDITNYEIEEKKRKLKEALLKMKKDLDDEDRLIRTKVYYSRLKCAQISIAFDNVIKNWVKTCGKGQGL